jgi:hypothetical protein
MPLNKEFKRLFDQPGKRFTIILGSGFHSQALGRNSILSNWEKLLKDQDSDLKLTKFYLLDYEQLIINSIAKNKYPELKDKTASGIEKQISNNICENIKKEQEIALNNRKSCYPKNIFNPKKVSDIISLNFDTIAEEICCESAQVKKAKKLFIESDSKSNRKFKIAYREVNFSEQGSMRFWYPHGSIHDKSRNLLGIREYSKHISNIESLRNYSKSKKKLISWYHQLTHNPVLILGASMQKDEWDIWFALINRARNFAKSDNQQCKYPIFQMRECECNHDHRHEWFEPLFTGISFKEQWKELEKLFNNIK